eukprot:scaffold2.g6773.t1
MPRAQPSAELAENLFRSKTVAEVREVEARTRHEIEEKKQQLRHVVGDSYRDLISSADIIIGISNSCHHVVDVVGSLQQGLADVASAIEQRRATPQEQAASSYDRLYALGSRVKFLVDTPEAIYGCLDTGDYLAAARRFARCLDIHKALSAHPKQIAHRFPLLHHQWPLVRKFRGLIWEHAVEWLGQQGEVTARQAAEALTALALLQPMDGAEVLKTYLSSRQAYLTQCLSSLAADKEVDPATLSVILSDLTSHVCTTVAHCGELFLPLPGVAAVPLLLHVAEQQLEGGEGELPLEPGSSEAAAWAAHRQALLKRLADLSTAGVALECSQWLDKVSQQMRQLGGGLLASCASGPDLLAVESAVRSALEGWRFSVCPQKDDTTAGATGGAASLALLVEGEAPEAGSMAMAWSDVCQWVLAQPCGLWQLLLEVPLVDRAKQLVAAGFTSLVTEVSELVDAALAEAAGLPPCAPGSYQLGGWADELVLQPGTPSQADAAESGGKRRRLSSTADSGGEASAASPNVGGRVALAAWLQRAEAVLQLFDQQLQGALRAALHACYGLQHGPAGGRSMGVPSRLSGSSSTPSSRALVLEPFVQERCAEAAASIAALLSSWVEELATLASAGAAGGAAFAPTAHQALVLGRVALGIADRSSLLPLVMGSPEQWAAAGKAAGGKFLGPAAATELTGQRLGRSGSVARGQRAISAAAPPASPQLEAIQRRCRHVGAQAYRLWADWAAAGLVAALLQAWAADRALVADAPLRVWEETVIADAGAGDPADEAGAAAGAMRFALPAAPSPAAMDAALGTCQEGDRAGGHSIDAAALQLLKWQVDGAAIAALQEAVQPGAPLAALSEKGALQLLLDVRFLHSLLASSPLPMAGKEGGVSATAAAVGARRRKLAALDGELSGRLDPIDWATYESSLSANQRRFMGRCQVLFGLLTRTHMQCTDGAPAPAASGSDSNVLRMASAGPRFAYLPVNTPAAALRQAPGALAAAPSGSAGGVPASLLGAAAAEASYSFASLGGLSGASQRAPTADGGSAAAGSGGSSVGAAAMEALGRAKGLGDKAATLLGDFGSMSARLGLPSLRG